MNTSKESLLAIANVIIGSSCDTAENIAEIIERGLCDEKNGNACGIRDAAKAVMAELKYATSDQWLVASISGIIARHCVSRDAAQDLLNAARKDEAAQWERKLAELTSVNRTLSETINDRDKQLVETTRVAEQFRKDLDQVAATHTAQMRNTVDAAKIAVEAATGRGATVEYQTSERSFTVEAVDGYKTLAIETLQRLHSVRKSLVASRKENEENSRNVTSSQKEIIRLRVLLEDEQARSNQLSLTADEAISDASYWKQAARQTQELLEKQMQETKSAMDESKAQIITLSDHLNARDTQLADYRNHSADLDAWGRKLTYQIHTSHALIKKKDERIEAVEAVSRRLCADRDTAERCQTIKALRTDLSHAEAVSAGLGVQLTELLTALLGSEKQVKEMGELVNQTKAQLDLANTTIRNITNLLPKP